MTEDKRQTTEGEGPRTNVFRYASLVLRHLAWFIFATVIAVVVIQHIALLGLAFAILGGIVLGVLVTREVRA